MTDTAQLADISPDDATLLPGLQIGVEQEYKWRLTPSDLIDADEITLAALQSAVPAPDGGVLSQSFRHTQSTIYFDDQWALADARMALRATINPGLARDVSWLGAKQTVAWRDGCRDALEVSERISPKAISGELVDQRTVPLQYIARICGRAPQLSAYAYIVQHRHKLMFSVGDGWLLQVSFDVAATRLMGGGATETGRWLEIENNSSDLRARHALNRWASELSDHLGHAPVDQSKSEYAAMMAGWEPAS